MNCSKRAADADEDGGSDALQQQALELRQRHMMTTEEALIC